MMESKMDRDKRMAKEAKADMPESAKMARKDLEAKIRVTFGRQTEGPRSWAVVHVFQKGMPHPKGLDAVIIDSRSDGGISREMNQAICDDAINFVRGQSTKFTCEEFQEEAGNDAQGASGLDASSSAPVTGNSTDGEIPRDMQVPPPADYPTPPQDEQKSGDSPAQPAV